MKKLIYALTIYFFGSTAFAASTPLFGAEGPQLRVETRIDIPNGATGLVFSAGKMTADFAFTSVCTRKESTCVLDTLDLAKRRDRYFDVNTILNLKNVPQMCGDGTGFVANVSTLRNQLMLRCKMVSPVVTAEELQAIFAGHMTVQFPSKIE